MKSWSDIRKTLEQDRLAPSLRGRVQYYITRYREAHDDAGRIAIRVDGEEVFNSSDFDSYKVASESWSWSKSNYPEADVWELYQRSWERELYDGAAEYRSIYKAFQKYDTQCIEQSLNDPNALVRVLAILDRRVGKRRLAAIKEQGYEQEPEWVQRFYRLRLEAESI